ncbi:hypothetical protein IIW29_02410, partial [Candidatus Saccharibacteria bacterium]|nr:hypothetical protein [Candidatus Saccharibacteria bacterium]
SLEYKGRSISAGEFIEAIHGDAGLYQAFNAATYDRAAYFYDESAEAVFKKLGTTRNNYNASSNFKEVMSEKMGEGSTVSVNNVGLFEKYNEETKEYYEEYETIGGNAGSSGSEAEEFVAAVAGKNWADSTEEATMNGANALNIADTITKEQKASLYFLTLMENISKMKAGQGGASKINEAMNYLFSPRVSKVIDVNSGEEIEIEGTMLESPSLNAILSGKTVDFQEVQNFASDRVLRLVENTTGNGVSEEKMHETVTSTGTKARGTIGRYLELTDESVMADYEQLEVTVPIINESMVDNGFFTIGGIEGGEMLVAGAVNVGAMLAQASGGTAGDGAAVKSYARLTNTVLALDREADRITRSPFDISSPNTFLGSLTRKLAFSSGAWSASNSVIAAFSSFGEVIGQAFSDLTPSSFADDAGTDYLTNFGDCQTAATVGAVGSVGCSRIITFDTSTLKDPFNDEGFMGFLEENTSMDESGKRTINDDSVLADFLKYNDERVTPVGVMDGGILKSLGSDSGLMSVPFVSDFVSMILSWLGASNDDKRIATGESFVMSSSNPDWETYKYAQRYVSLARATSALRQYDGGDTAYTNIPGFEGGENPVIAFLNQYYEELAQR